MDDDHKENEEAKQSQPPISPQKAAIEFEEVEDAAKPLRIRPVSGCTPYPYVRVQEANPIHRF